MQAPFAYVDDLSHVWCQWAEMELKHHNYRRAMQVLTRAVEEPDVSVAPKRLTADEHKVRLWSRGRVLLWPCVQQKHVGYCMFSIPSASCW